MTGRQRIVAALAGTETDAVPVMLHNFMMAAREYGASMAEFRADPVVAARALVASVERYRFDGIVVDVDTATLAGALGVPVDCPPDLPARTTGRRLSTLEAVSDLAPPRIGADERVQAWLETVRLTKRAVGDEIFVRGNCDQAPFSLASMVRGLDAWMVDLATGDEALIHRLLGYCAEATTEFVGLMAETGCDMVSNGDSPAGPDLISPRMYRRFALPYEARVADAAHARGLPYALHVCGKTNAILDAMLDSGADAFELDHRTDASRARAQFGERAVFIGNVDPSGVLALGTVDDVRRRTRALLATFRGSRRFILNAGCAIPAETPPANLEALIGEARSFA